MTATERIRRAIGALANDARFESWRRSTPKMRYLAGEHFRTRTIADQSGQMIGTVRSTLERLVSRGELVKIIDGDGSFYGYPTCPVREWPR